MSVTTMKTPGVYIQELDAFGNAVVPVPTAIPAFIGYTGQTSYNGKNLVNKAVKVTSLAEFSAIFGSTPPQIQFDVINTATEATKAAATAAADATAAKAVPATPAPAKAAADKKAAASQALADAAAKAALDPDFTTDTNGVGYKLGTTTVNYRLFSAIRFFYENGGGTCYIVSVGGYDYSLTGLPSVTPFEDALAVLVKEAEPTMVIIPEAVEFMDPTEPELKKRYQNCYSLQGQMINHCGSLKTRVALIDIPGGFSEPLVGETSVQGFRDAVEPTLPKFNSYAAAYYPWLHTTVNQLTDISYNNIAKGSHSSVVTMLKTEFPEIVDVKKGTKTDNPFKKYIDALFSIAPQGDPIAPKASATAADAQVVLIKSALGTASTASGLAKTNAGTDVTTANGVLTTANGSLTTASGAVATPGSPTTAEAKKIATATAAVEKAKTEVTTAKANLVAATSLDKGTKAAVVTATATKAITAAAVTSTGTAGVTPLAAITEAVTAKNALIKLIREAKTTALTETEINAWLVVASVPIIGADNISPDKSDSVLKNLSNSYKMLLKHVLEKLNLMPPSAAMAGIYTVVDNNEGVWTAPANVGVQSVVAPSVKIDHQAQEDLNVPLDGKSVSAIRSFPGKGVLVWGARTLDGNSNDWRYINVRRALIYIEQSVKEAASAYVFAPNDASTWVSVKSMVSNFLLGIWNQGGLVGPKPADAFSVTVGLGSTMTSDDILQGKMIVAVKVALSHPAEFIEITFQQEMQKG